MNASELELPGVLLIEPDVYRDDRGYFLETWRDTRYRDLGIDRPFLQDNVSYSRRNVIRGLHYQNPSVQGKLVSVLAGTVFDVIVDVRVGSPTFGRWIGRTLSDDRPEQIWIPEGFAHGFAVLSESAVFSYKCTAHYSPAAEGTVLWNDPELGIEWPIDDPIVSEKDRKGLPLSAIGHDRLPRYEHRPGAG